MKYSVSHVNIQRNEHTHTSTHRHTDTHTLTRTSTCTKTRKCKQMHPLHTNMILRSDQVECLLPV